MFKPSGKYTVCNGQIALPIFIRIKYTYDKSSYYKLDHSKSDRKSFAVSGCDPGPGKWLRENFIIKCDYSIYVLLFFLIL